MYSKLFLKNYEGSKINNVSRDMKAKKESYKTILGRALLMTKNNNSVASVLKPTLSNAETALMDIINHIEPNESSTLIQGNIINAHADIVSLI